MRRYIAILLLLFFSCNEKRIPSNKLDIHKLDSIETKKSNVECINPTDSIHTKLDVAPNIKKLSSSMAISKRLKIAHIIDFYHSNVYMAGLDRWRNDNSFYYVDCSSYNYMSDSIIINEPIDYCSFNRVYYNDKKNVEFIEYYSMNSKSANLTIYPFYYKEFTILMAGVHNPEYYQSYEIREKAPFVKFAFTLVDKKNNRIIGFKTDINRIDLSNKDVRYWQYLYMLDNNLFPIYSISLDPTSYNMNTYKYPYLKTGYMLKNYYSFKMNNNSPIKLNNQTLYYDILDVFNKIELQDQNGIIVPDKTITPIMGGYKNIAAPPLWAAF